MHFRHHRVRWLFQYGKEFVDSFSTEDQTVSGRGLPGAAEVAWLVAVLLQRPQPRRAGVQLDRALRGAKLAKLTKFAKFRNNHFAIPCTFLAGSFSAVSKPIFARKYAFDSIFQALQDLHTFAPLQSQILGKNRFEKSAIFVKFQQKCCQCCKICKILSNFKNFSLRIW